MTFHGAAPEMVAAPTRPIEGIVRDVDTGAAIAGAAIRSYKLADSEVSNTDIVHTNSDAQGRFRLVGMPPGAGNEVVIAPPIDQPYLPLAWLADKPRTRAARRRVPPQAGDLGPRSDHRSGDGTACRRKRLLSRRIR